MLVNEQVHKTIDLLGKEFTMDELFERLNFIENVKEGLLDIESGNVLSEEELEQKMQEW